MEFYLDLTIRIETIAIVNKNLIDSSISISRKQLRIDLSLDSLANEATSKARFTRTNRLLEQSRSKVGVSEDMGNIDC